jgi:hypothetical protein
MPPVAKVFISYQHDPSLALALLISEKLRQYNLQVFVDVERLDSVGPFPKRLLKAIQDGDIFVCLLANTTLEAKWVLREIDYAYTMRKPMIPVFQESYVAPVEPIAHSVAALLEHQGVPVLDKRGVLVDESIDKLARMILEMTMVESEESETLPEPEEISPEPSDSPLEPSEPTVRLDETLRERPQPSRTRWLWPLSAIIILLVGFGAFLYLNGLPPNRGAEALTQTAIALVGGVTDTPTETPAPSATATSTLADTPEPSATATPTDIPTATRFC